MSGNEDKPSARKRDDRENAPAPVVETLIIEDVPAHRKLNAMDGKLDALLVGQAALQTDVFLTPLKILGGGALMMFAWDQVNRRSS